MSRLSEMLYGDLETVDSLLEYDCEPAELRAAMQNLLRRVQVLESAVQKSNALDSF